MRAIVPSRVGSLRPISRAHGRFCGPVCVADRAVALFFEACLTFAPALDTDRPGRHCAREHTDVEAGDRATPSQRRAVVTAARAAETGLYSADYEHDACGVAFVARLDATPQHETVERALQALENLEHRGATGADAGTGDGAGILLQLPDAFFRAVLEQPLPEPGRYGVAMCFLPAAETRRTSWSATSPHSSRRRASWLVCWRDVPVDAAYVGVTAGAAAPVIRQLFVAAGDAVVADQDAFERKLYVIRRRFELEFGADAVVPSFSSRTIVYKGMLTAPQLRGYFPDLQDERTASALALVHSRFSTNTFPSWELAHPYRMIAHNGEINTVRGNINWMRARESQLASELFGNDLGKVLPVVQSGGSDSATLDNVLELLVLGGRSLPHAIMMMIPEATAGRTDLLARAARVLRLPPVPDGGVGRPRGGLVHGRSRDRSDARSQRPATGAMARDARRLGRSRLGGRRARHPRSRRSPQGSPPARAALPRRSRAGSDRSERRGEACDRDPAAVRGMVRPRGRGARRSARAGGRRQRPPRRYVSARSPSATRRRT